MPFRMNLLQPLASLFDTVDQSEDNTPSDFPLVPLEDLLEDGEEIDCPICLKEYGTSPLDDPVELPCGHIFGETCIEEWRDQHLSCPLCRAALEPRWPVTEDIQGPSIWDHMNRELLFLEPEVPVTEDNGFWDHMNQELVVIEPRPWTGWDCLCLLVNVVVIARDTEEKAPVERFIRETRESYPGLFTALAKAGWRKLVR